MNLGRALADVVGEANVFESPELCAPYERDWTGRFSGRCRMVVRPASAQEVAAVLQACTVDGATVVPQGGNTGLVGASTPRGGEVVLSTRRLCELSEVDRALAQIEVGAGVPLWELQQQAAASGFDCALDLAARGSATVGGLVACDAGGARALRHGTAGARVAGLEAVLPNGVTVSRLSGLVKDNAGLDLTALLVGSEGILGVITRVLWRLVPLLPARITAIVPLAEISDAVRVLAALRVEAPALEACDFLFDDGMELVLRRQRRSSPLRSRAPLCLLVELADRTDPTDQLIAALDAAGIPGKDVLIADDARARARLWSLREDLSEAIAAEGLPRKVDVGVPLDSLERFLREVGPAVRAVCPDAVTHRFGHLGDGNVHVNVLGASEDDDRVDGAVLALALACGGTISAEHGVGIAKTAWMDALRGPGEVSVLRAVAAAIDPAGMMNPGAVLPVVKGPSPAAT